MNIFEILRKEKHEDENYPEKSWSVADLVRAFKKNNPNSKIDRNKINRIENNSQSPDVDTLIAYSKVFDVSVDYLLDLSPSKSIDENMKMICGTTGLSDDSIATLKTVKKHWDKREKNILNYIMKDTDLFLDFLKWLSLYIDNEYTIPLAYDKEKGMFPCNNVMGNVVLGKKAKDNKGNDGYKMVGVSVDILESHAMLKMQEIINTWKNIYKKENDSNKTT